MAEGTFATAVTCMDGRVQEPVSAWMRDQFQVDYVDTITDSGLDGVLADGSADAVASIRRRVEISVDAHGSRVVVVVAHHDCAGNPGDKDHHLAHLVRALRRVGAWGLPIRLYGVWVNREWEVEPVYEAQVPDRD